ncbi:hypothetical protein AP064_05055 [Candidatus Liberibacter solanacearum]|uniref:hypothetical protein n=1 Tax=Candidatus Liberibacter solanacearum TaxID=556287 RepID=UPI0006DBF66A|nr:hypothetical protein [Candidatus Liberibacter solanacearum]KQC48729.1 hypothetical protein AP064_05055 [Candidatus Liberibacter solanacearum]
MPKGAYTKRSFAGGEVSPQIIQSRSDLELHSQGLSQCFNMIPLQDGSLVRRPPLYRYEHIDLPPKASRILSFALGGDEAVLFIFGEKKMVYVEVTGIKPPQFIRFYGTPYSFREAEQLDVARMGTLIVLVHPKHSPYKIEFTEAGVIFEKMVFAPPPWLGRREVGGKKHDAKLRVTLSATRKGKITVTSTLPIFKTKDVGRMLRLGWLPKDWTANTLYPENAFMQMYGKVYRCITEGISGKEFGDNRRDTYIRDGGVTWKVIASSQALSVDKDGKSTLGTGGQYRTPYYVWGEIVNCTGAKTVEVMLHEGFCVTDSNSTLYWNMSAWGEREGYPSHVSFYNNRLCFSGSKFDPQAVYFSGYNTFTDFSPDTIEGNVDYRKSLSVAITDDTMSAIRWFRPMEKGLVIGTDTSLWIVILDFERGFNLVSRRLAGIGVYEAPPLSIGDELIFVQGAGRRIQIIGGASEQGFQFLELTQNVDHLLDYRIRQLAYQEDPYSLLWVLNNKGELLSCSLHANSKEKGSWHVHKLGGRGVKIMSLSSCLCLDQGETTVWFLVSRTNEDGVSSIGLERLRAFNPLALHGDGLMERTN